MSIIIIRKMNLRKYITPTKSRKSLRTNHITLPLANVVVAIGECDGAKALALTDFILFAKIMVIIRLNKISDPKEYEKSWKRGQVNMIRGRSTWQVEITICRNFSKAK